MLVNELAQWAVLVFLAIAVFGLIRQLGTFIVPRQEQLLLRGPDVGSELPRELLQDIPVAELQRRAAESQHGVGLIAFVNDGCTGCHGLLERLEKKGWASRTPLVAVADTVDADFESRLRAAFDYVIVDLGLRRSRGAGITATPFVIGFDEQLKVKHRAIAGGLHELMDELIGLKMPAEPGVYAQEAAYSEASAAPDKRDEVVRV